MNRSEKRAIERALPRRYRSKKGYGRLLGDLTLRVSVSGTRGKSRLTRMVAESLMERGLSVYAKETGTRPISWKDGAVREIQRDPRKSAVLNETYWEVKRHAPMDAIVLENQGITPYTMRTFHRIYCRPQYLLVTNVRRDHLADLARTRNRMAKEFVRSVPKGTTVVSGERDPEIKAIMEREAVRAGIRFLDASPPEEMVPGLETVTITDTLLRDWMQWGLTHDEHLDYRRGLEARFQWQDSTVPGVKWFHGAEINDVDSTQSVLDYLIRNEPRPVTFVAYLRRDRVDRTATFIPFLREQLRSDVASQVIVVGHRARGVRRRLRHWKGRVHVFADDEATVPTVLRHVAETCRDEAVMTIMNAVPPWPSRFAQAMEDDGTEFQAAAPRGLPQTAFTLLPPPDPRPRPNWEVVRS